MPKINADVTCAMHEAIRSYAKSQSARTGARVTIGDVVVAALRNAGFEREDVLEALQDGKCPDIDVRRRMPARQRPPLERITEYLAERGCTPESMLARNLHLAIAEIRRAIVEAE